ncbi:MAG: HD-GYP domain-containing protein [Dehalococcoidia bacterium]|nr:MAG: HD-GYP domain-containing protein [Dehalococcoidia bacterium]
MPGMKLSRPIFGLNGELLLRAGAVLTARNIMSLRRNGVLAVEINGPISFEGDRDVITDEVRRNMMGVVREWTFKRCDEVAVKTGKTELVEITKSVEVIVEEILSGKEVAGSLAEICSCDIYTYAHSVDVCILSLMVGVKLGYPKPKLLRLGVGSLLHDIGKVKVPAEILNKPGELTPNEFAEIKKHPEYGRQMFVNIRNASSQSAAIILNHHERYDGSGYPRSLKGDKIDEMSAICGVADVYNAITTDRVYRKALPPHEAYEMIMASGGFMFNFKVVNAFLECVTPYPVGSMVRLSNGLAGVVCKLNVAPFRPVVKTVEGEEIDLLDRANISVVIADVMHPEELRNLASKETDTINAAAHGKKTVQARG